MDAAAPRSFVIVEFVHWCWHALHDLKSKHPLPLTAAVTVPLRRSVVPSAWITVLSPENAVLSARNAVLSARNAVLWARVTVLWARNAVRWAPCGAGLSTPGR